MRLVPNDRNRDMLDALADRFGWWHPGLLLVAETFLALCPPYRAVGPQTEPKPLPADHAAQTWVLLVGGFSTAAEGIPGRLHVERVPGGCGAVYPHPLAGGYLWTKGCFQTALDHSRLAALHEAPLGQEFDYRWWIDLTDPAPGQEAPRMARLEGRSAELPVAAALCAAAQGDILGRHAVGTACFQDPAAGDFRLETVNGVAVKAGGVLHRLKGVSEILVARDQGVALDEHVDQADRDCIELEALTVVRLSTFAEAYEQLSHWTRITRQVNQRLAARAEGELRKCDPYIRLPISWRDDQTARGPDKDPWQRLSPPQFDEFCRGRLRLPAQAGGDDDSADSVPRLIVLAESGMGKSTLLWDCQRSIADGETERVAVLVRDLSAIPWNQTDDALRELVHRPLAGCFGGEDHEPSDREVRDYNEWLWRLVRQGKVVLLLDAVDQTAEDFDFGPLGGFLASDVIRRCPAIVTGRDHVLSTRSRLFHQQSWYVFRVEGFQTDDSSQDDLRAFLGGAGDVLLIERGKRPWNYTDQNRLKQTWQDLLRVPLLAKLLRSLVRAGNLDGLKNREAVYHQAMTDLMSQGFRSLQKGQPAHKLLDVVEAAETLEELAWHSVGQDDFRGRVTGRCWRALHHQFRDQPWKELEQVDILTIHTLLERLTDTPDTALTWRHLSFCEYFAGARLAKMEPAEQTAVIQKQVRNPRWDWVFRFALARLQRKGNRSARDHLAQCLVRYGNPFLLYDAIRDDGIAPAAEVDRLCRWLVHRDFKYELRRGYTDAWRDDHQPPLTDLKTLDILEDLFRREYRNGCCLHPAWELVQSVVRGDASQTADDGAMQIAQRISEGFLSEFADICANPSDPGHKTALALKESFVRCPKHPDEDGKPFLMGSPEGEGNDDERPQHAVVVQPFCLMRCPVTNLQYELMDPLHAVDRNRYSQADDQPAIYVNWYMAQIFSTWLGQGCRLPTEAEWEYACRAGSRTRYCFGDDASLLSEYAWYDEGRGGRTHPVGGKRPNAWGLYDMHGNVWEWCADWYRKYGSTTVSDPTGPRLGSYPVYRGGGWSNVDWRCRSVSRIEPAPAIRSRDCGFRLAFSSVDHSGTQSGQSSSSAAVREGRILSRA